MRRPDRADGMLVLANVLWSLNYATTKYAFERWNPLAFSGIRFTAAGLAMAVVVRVREGGLGVDRRDVPRVVVAGATGIFLNQLTFNYALDYTAAANVALLLGAAPAFTAAFSAALGHERVRRTHWLALGVSLIGVALVVQGGSGVAGFSLKGDLLAIGAALTWAAYSVMLRPLFGRYSAMRLSTLMILVGAVLMAPFAGSQARPPGLRPHRRAALGRARLLGGVPARRHQRALLRRPAARRRRPGDPLHVPAAVPGRALRRAAPGRAHRPAADRRRRLHRRRSRARAHLRRGPPARRGHVGTLSAVPTLPDLYAEEAQQMDNLCGCFWGSLALRAAGFDADQEAVALAARSILPGGDPLTHIFPGSTPRNDYRVELPLAAVPETAGTAAPPLAEAIELLSGSALAAIPVAGPWTSETRLCADGCGRGRPGDPDRKRAHRRPSGGRGPIPAVVVDHLMGGSPDPPPADWDVGHFVNLATLVRGPGGSIVVVRDTYQELGAAAATTCSRPTASLRRCAATTAARAASWPCAPRRSPPACANASRASGFELRHWDNGTPEPPERRLIRAQASVSSARITQTASTRAQLATSSSATRSSTAWASSGSPGP